MGNFKLFAHPWWVNLLLLVPLVAYFLFRREKPQLTSRELLTCAMFALSFGFVEGAVAIYLGVAVGLLSAHAGPLSDVARVSADLHGQQSQPLNNLPPALLRIEVFREAASMLMLLSVAILAQHKRRERFAIFLWIFALWDMGYYVALWATVRWPNSPTSADVLFFIPVPWISQVWFPLLISILTGAVILLTRPRNRTD
jgi:hypothetical protein